MNYECIVLLNRMKKLQYYDFIRYALGMKFFLINDDQEIRVNVNEITESKKENTEKDNIKREKIKEIAYLYSFGKRKLTFIIKNGDFENKQFRDNKGAMYSVLTYFDEIDIGLIWAIMMGVLGVEKFSEEYSLYDGDIGKKLFESYDKKDFGFILGAGINNGYGLGNWNALISDIRNRIKMIKGIPQSSNQDRLIDFENTMSNTNYIAPQILKDLDAKAYYDVIYNNLYSAFRLDDTKRVNKPSIEDTTLYQVARIISKRSNINVLTFNYDNVLELVLDCNFKLPVNSVYKGSRYNDYIISIVHSHGFYPYGQAGEKYAHSIVFSCYEYMNGYLNPATYARKKLNEQIMHPCILIGNSLSDYEEQKVFYLHHKRYLSHYSFLFTTISIDDPWMDIYKSIYFLKMGVIPVFFVNYKEMIEYLKLL